MKTKRQALIAAFPFTLPILAGFMVLGISYGLLMSNYGFPFYYPLLMSIFIFAGSMQFVAVNLLLIAFDPLSAIFLTLLVNARHLFYGLSLLDKYQNSKLLKPYLIFGLCDETFSLVSTLEIPEGIDKHCFYFFITLLNQIYWVLASLIGGFFGQLLSFNAEGLDFVLTALFTVIFIDQWLKTKNHLPSLIGLGSALVCLLVLGPEYFMVAAMITTLILFYFAYKKTEYRK